MRLSKKLIAGLAGAVVVVVALTASFVFLGADPAAAPKSVQAAAAPAEAAATPTLVAANDAAMPQVLATADFATMYTSFKQLATAADLVVRGEVTEVSYLDFNTSAYTKVTLKVSESFKGAVKAGDSITILEVGGVTDMAVIKGDKFGVPTKEDAATKVEVLLDGAPLTEVGDKCLYFLGTGSIGVVPGTYYVPMGAFQGRFKSDSGVTKRFVPSDWDSARYTSLAVDDSAVADTLTEAAAQ
jgi:hypothetical protein